jgi:YD repeat-containing protein
MKMNRRRGYRAALWMMMGWAWMWPIPAGAQLPLPQPGSLIVTITSPKSGSTVGGTITVSASVSVVGSLTVAGVQFRLDGADLGAEDTTAPYSISWNTTAASNGSHTLRAVARDILGVRWTSDPVTVTVFNDKTPPTVSLTSPASGSTVSGTITVSATASDNVGVVWVQFLLDGVGFETLDTTAPYSTEWNTTMTHNGSHTLTAVARDAAGNGATSAPVTVTVSNEPPPDTTPPTVTMTSPSGGATVSGTVTVSADVSDNVGVAGVQFQLDGAPLGVEDTTTPYSTAWDTTTASNASHTLTAVARDAAGNSATSAGVTVTVSNGGAAVTRFEESAASYAGAGWVPRGPEIAVFSGGSAVSSDMAGDTASFTFTGTAVSWIGLKCNICGIASVSIDGGAAASVDTAGAAAPGSPGLASEVVFTAEGLPAASHTLTITVTGVTTSGGTHIVLDAFDVAGTEGGPPPAATRIEDTDPSVSYTGNWIHITNEPQATAGTAAESNEAGAVAALSFTGTGVSWVGFRYDGGGIARVFIDGTMKGEVDTYSHTVEPQTVVFTASGLPPGAHTLTIEVTGTNNPSATAPWIIVDAFDVTP